jgi:TolB protein
VAVTVAAGAAVPLAAQDTSMAGGVRLGLTYQAGVKPGVLVLLVKGEHGDSARALLVRDLDYGDRVTMVAERAEDVPPMDGVPNYALLSRLGAAALVQATMTQAGALHIALHDVAAQRVIQVRDFPLPEPELGPAWRMAVHGASDEVERWITGVRGIAQTRIAFVRGGQVWLVDSDGANAAPVAGGGGALSPAWHPSGAYLAYVQLGETGPQVLVRDLRAGTDRRVTGTRSGSNITPAFSPDGRTLVYGFGDENGTDLYAVDAFDGGARRRVTVGRGSENASPSFAPDGRRLAFTSGRLGHPEVYISDIDGSNAELLTTTGFEDQKYRSNPEWSPDGRVVAFQSQIGGIFQVMTIGLGDRRVRTLTSEGSNEDPSWAPDGRHLVFTSTRSGARQLWVLDTESGRLRQLTRGAPARLGAWSPPLGGR